MTRTIKRFSELTLQVTGNQNDSRKSEDFTLQIRPTALRD